VSLIRTGGKDVGRISNPPKRLDGLETRPTNSTKSSNGSSGGYPYYIRCGILFASCELFWRYKGTFASYDEVCSENLGPIQADIAYSHATRIGEMFEQRIDLLHDG
jgi:hypothetical protein